MMIRPRISSAVVFMVTLGLLGGTAGAQRTYKKESQSDTRMQSQTQQAPQRQVSGTVLRSKDVQIHTLGQDTGQHNRVVLLQTQDGQRLVVDLGPKQHLQKLSLQQGTRLQAQGRPVRISDRPVLLATQITVDGKTQQIQRPERSQAQDISGQVQRMKEVEIRGTDRTNQVALVKTVQGRQFVVDLGPPQALQDIKLRQGMQLKVQGRPVRIGDRMVLLAQQVTANGQTVHINRPPQPMAQQQQKQSRQQAEGRWEHPQVSMLNVASAGDLIGHRVRDTQGHHTGTVEYLMINAQNGDVLYALIGSGGALDIGDNLIAVPWQAVERKQQDLTVHKTLQELKTAPHFPPDRLAELTQPAIVSLIQNYYLLPKGQEQPDAKQQQAPQGQQGGQTSQPRLLIGREVITTLVEPVLTSAQAMQGTQVTGMQGQKVGAIDKVLIDPDHGHVAYVLLAQAPFLGLGGQWLPVPFEALEWSMSRQNYLLTVSVDTLRQMPLLPRQTLPTKVSAANLRQLYAHYNVTPYWERAAQAAERPGQRQRASITATVQELDKQQGIVTLQTAGGKAVDLQVSQRLLNSLQAGDRVEVTIRQSPEGQQPGRQRMLPSGQQR